MVHFGEIKGSAFKDAFEKFADERTIRNSLNEDGTQKQNPI